MEHKQVLLDQPLDLGNLELQTAQVKAHPLWGSLNQVIVSVTTNSGKVKIHLPPVDTHKLISGQMHIVKSRRYADFLQDSKHARNSSKKGTLKDHAEEFLVLNRGNTQRVSSTIYVDIQNVLGKYKQVDVKMEFFRREMCRLYLLVGESRPIVQEEFLQRMNKIRLKLVGVRDRYDSILHSIIFSYSTASKDSSFPRKAQIMLLDWLQEHKNHPYPTKQQKQDLCKKAGITLHQLNQWFTNARIRILKPKEHGESSTVSSRRSSSTSGNGKSPI
jgi:hypothetical protein